MKYSIITISKNNLAGLRNTYQSIKEQTYTNFEWIVVDGASNDGTEKWLTTIKEMDCLWSSEKDKGIFDAMNKGIDRAAGDYLIFMNAGDEFEAFHTLKKVDEAIEHHEVRPYFVYGDSIDFTSDNRTFLRKAKRHIHYIKTMFTQHQAMLFDNHFAKLMKIKYPLDYKYTADYAYISLFLKNIKDEQYILKLNFPVCRFLLGGTNEQYRFKALREDYLIRKNIIKMNGILAYTYYILHYIHTLAKRVNPGLTQKWRYQ
jgi:putative colanic acid biosynthesis glycosyltransferase